MKAFKANTSENSNGVCFVCKKEISNNGCFRRVPPKPDGSVGSRAMDILLCSPFCALRYFGDSQPGGNSFEPNYDGYEHARPVAPEPKPSKAMNDREAIINENKGKLL